MPSSLTVYHNPKVIAVAFLGFASGLPLPLILGTLSIWLAEEDISKTSIGLFSVLTTPYILKFLWAPLADRLPIPYLTNRLGRRTAWILTTQSALIITITGLGLSDPTTDLWNTALWALLVAIASATQDIVIDAYRVEILQPEQQGAGAASIVFGYNIGMRLIGGAFALILADSFSWFVTYAIMAAFIGVGMITVLLTGEPGNNEPPSPPGGRATRLSEPKVSLAAVDGRQASYTESSSCPPPNLPPGGEEPLPHTDNHQSLVTSHIFKETLIAPFTQFMQKDGWWLILLFVLLYKFGDAFAGIMTNPFLIELGFSKTEIGTIAKIYGLGATLIGSFLGGALIYRLGTIKSLWICGILQMLSNLIFIAQAHIGHDTTMLAVTIGIENLSAGMGTGRLRSLHQQPVPPQLHRHTIRTLKRPRIP